MELTLTVNWPTNTDPSRYRLRFEDHLVYLADYNAWAEPDGRLALRGAASAELALRGPRLGSRLLAEIENGPVRNRVRLSIGGRTATVELDPGATELRLFADLDPLVVGTSRLLLLRAECERGGIPRYLTGDLGADHRYLGAHIRLAVAPERIAERLYRARRWADLAEVVRTTPPTGDAFYAARAAEALGRLGREHDAALYRERVDEQLPDLLNRLRRAIPGSIARPDAIGIGRSGERWHVGTLPVDLPIPPAPDGQSAGLQLLGALPRGRYGIVLRLEDLPSGAEPELRGFIPGQPGPHQLIAMQRSDPYVTARFDSQGEARWELSLGRAGWSDAPRLRYLRLIPDLSIPSRR
jgi:hypothetical protein